jgi:hypothetical protein
MSENIIENASAIRYFNEEAEKLFGLLVELKEPERKRPPLKSIQEEVISKIIYESEIKNSFIFHVDLQGNETARYFQISSDKWLGIDSEHYHEIRKLSANIYKKREINDRIGKDTLIKIIFEWIKVRISNIREEPLPFMEYLNKSIEQKITNVKISIPIINMAIDLEFEVGKIRFEYMKKELFDEIDTKLKEKVASKEMPENEYTTFVSKLRKDHQGKVVGTISVKAETEKATEIAEKEVDRAIAALKYFSPFAFVSQAAAIFGRKGMTWIPSREIFVFTDTLPTIHQGLIGNQNLFKIDGVLLAKLKAAGLDKLSELMLKSDLSEFEDLIFTALYTFTKAISQIDFHERLVFILSALEIVLLKDGGEPIQIHVGQRLGFLTSQDPDKRREAVSLVSDGYKIRSNYIHHGQEEENYEILSKLQCACWNALNIMINHHEKFKNKQEFMSYIEKLIYS